MKKFTLNSLFENDRFLRVFSVVLALIAWAVVTTYINAEAPKTIRNVPVSVDLSGTVASDLVVVDMDHWTLDVKISGLSYKTGSLGPDDIKVTMDLSTVGGPGEYELALLITKSDPTNNDFSITSNKTEKVNVKFDQLETEQFSLEGYAPNVTAVGGDNLFVSDNVIVTPQEITVSGPKTEVDRIRRVQIETDETAEITKTQTFAGQLRFYDANDSLIDGKAFSYSDEEYTLTVPVYRQIEVPLTFDFLNVPEGIDETALDFEMSAQTIRLGIPVDAPMIENIALGSIDFRKIDIGSVFTLKVNLLASYINLDNIDTVTVEFPSDAMASATLSSENIVVVNKPADYDVDVLTSKLSGIKFVGKESVIESLSNEDVIVTVDLQKLDTEGERVLTVAISLNGNQQAWAVGKDDDFYTVMVRAEKK